MREVLDFDTVQRKDIVYVPLGKPFLVVSKCMSTRRVNMSALDFNGSYKSVPVSVFNAAGYRKMSYEEVADWRATGELPA